MRLTPTKREFVFLVGGVGIGVYVPKRAPNLMVVKTGRFYKEIFSAYLRLQKILKTEYHRIDEAIQTEEALLQMINPQNIATKTLKISFTVDDNGRDRSVTLNMFQKPPRER